MPKSRVRSDWTTTEGGWMLGAPGNVRALINRITPSRHTNGGRYQVDAIQMRRPVYVRTQREAFALAEANA